MYANMQLSLFEKELPEIPKDKLAGVPYKDGLVLAKLLRPSQLAQYYLMASFLYYVKDSNIMSDTDYDSMLRRMSEKKVWKEIRKHPHAKLIERTILGNVRAPFRLREFEYPLICQSSALYLHQNLYEASHPKSKLKFRLNSKIKKPKLRFKIRQ